MIPFTIIEKNPNVIMFSGKERIERIGLRRNIIRAKIMPPIMYEGMPPVMVSPERRSEVRKRAVV